MASLAGFERLIETLIERSLIAPLRGRVQPIEIAKRLERAMRDGSLVNVGTYLAPNEYLVRLNPEDFQPLAAARSMLERELARHLARSAAEKGYAFLAPPIVRFVADPSVARRAIQVTGELREPGSAGVAAPRTTVGARPAPVQPVDSPAAVTGTRARPAAVEAHPDPVTRASPWELDFGTWKVPLPTGAVRVGRAPDCDVVVPSPRVS